MTVLQAFLEGVFRLAYKGDGVIAHWPNEDYDMEMERDENNNVLVTVSDGENTKKYRVKLEEVK
jgi:hypothetical protein